MHHKLNIQNLESSAQRLSSTGKNLENVAWTPAEPIVCSQAGVKRTHVEKIIFQPKIKFLSICG